MKKFIAILIALFVFASIVPAQNMGSNKVVVAYVILYADNQTDLQQKVQNYLNLGTGWQPWGTMVLSQAYCAVTKGKLSQVMVQYKESE